MTNTFHTQVVLTFDRLPAMLLSCYGNEWMETQNFDRLAGQSTVFEDHYAETPGSAGPNHPWWTGRFEFFNDQRISGSAATEPDQPPETCEPTDLNALVKQLSDFGIACHFVAERSSELPALQNGQFEIVEGTAGLDADHTDSHFAKLIDRGIELLNNDQPQFIWLHSRGVPSPWLPARIFAELYLDELEDADETGPDVARALLDGLVDDVALQEVLFGEELLAGTDLSATDLSATDEFNNHRLADSQLTDRELGAKQPLAELETSAPKSSVAEPDTNSGAAQNDTGDTATNDRFEQFGPFAEAVSRYLFAGYVSQLDHLLGRLLSQLETLESSTDQSIGFIVTAASGQSFAERQAFVSAPELRALELTEQSLLTPLIVRTSGTATFGHRVRGMLQPVDLLPIVQKMFQPADELLCEAGTRKHDDAFDALTRQQAVHFGSTGEIGIRDAQWSFVAKDRAEVESFDPTMVGLHDSIGSLFVKPDDQHDINNVVNQEQDEAARLIEDLKQHLPARK